MKQVSPKAHFFRPGHVSDVRESADHVCHEGSKGSSALSPVSVVVAQSAMSRELLRFDAFLLELGHFE